MEIIRATEEHISLLTQFRISYLEEANPNTSSCKEQLLNSLPNYFKWHLNSDIFAYFAKDEDGYAACAFLLVIEKPASPNFITGKTGLVLNVYTKPEHRRKGCGKQLIEQLLVDASNLHLSYVELHATKDGFPLYKQIGFQTEDYPQPHMFYNIY